MSGQYRKRSISYKYRMARKLACHCVLATGALSCLTEDELVSRRIQRCYHNNFLRLSESSQIAVYARALLAKQPKTLSVCLTFLPQVHFDNE